MIEEDVGDALKTYTVEKGNSGQEGKTSLAGKERLTIGLKSVA